MKRYFTSLVLAAAGVATAGVLPIACQNDGSAPPTTEAAERPSPAAKIVQAPLAAGAPDGVFFLSPIDGAQVFENVGLRFGLRGKTLAAAGSHPGDPAYGHHHVLVDAAPIAAGQAIPADETHIHFGQGQEAAAIKLPRGEHRLTLQLGDAAHLSYGPDWSKTITITVVATPPELGVAFVTPKDGATVSGKGLKVGFAVSGMVVAPAGKDIASQISGHHHLIIDGTPVAAGSVVPSDDTHLHFGKGEIETLIDLAPGNHKLTLQFADGAHLSYGEQMSKTIDVVAQ